MSALGLIINGTSTSQALSYVGGRTAVVASATTFAGSTSLQVLGLDGSSWISVASFSNNVVLPLDLPAGYYRALINGTSALGVSVGLCTVDYNRQ